MVGQLMVEDEYTISVKLRRPVQEDGCLPPPTITISPEAPAITLTPPPNTTYRHIQAAKSVNGAPPVMIGCTTVESPQVEAPPGQLCIMPPPPPVRRGRHQEDPQGGSGQVTHGCLRLPLVHVYSDDNTLVATNKFLVPSPEEPAPAPPQQALALPGAIYVPRIPAHCKSDSGMLYVPPVEEEKLRAKKKEEPPARGNSRRVRREDGGASSRQLLPARTEGSKAAARALLTEVLGSRLEARPRPLSPRSPTRSLLPPAALHQDSPSNPTNVLAITYHDDLPIRGRQDDLAVRGRQDDLAVRGRQDDLAVRGRQDDLAVRGRQDDLAVRGRQDDLAERGRQDDLAVRGRQDDLAVRGRQDDLAVRGRQDDLAVRGRQDDLAVRGRPDDLAVRGRQEAAGNTAPGVGAAAGERVVEVYGGVQQVPPHQTPAAPVGGLAGHVVDLARPHPAVDPAHLTSLDLESDLHHHPGDAMLVSDPPHPAYHDLNHDLNHNNHHVFTHKPPEDVSHVNGRAAKYVVNDSDSLTGHDNYAFESELSGQDNYGYDPGYSSERSPEEEEGPPLFCHASQRKGIAAPESYSAQHDRRSLKLTPGHVVTTRELMKLFPFINEGTVFEVTVIKNLRGLGLAVTGGIECDVLHAGLIRIKKLYPQTPAWLCGQLEVGDILLHANTQPLTGLSSHEALEMLRTAEREVTLEVCRPPRGAMGEGLDTIDGCSSLGVVTTSLIPPTTSHNYLSPSPSFSSFGEFEIELTKVAGSLGFTLRKQDNSILGHTIRSLVKEPAISDGRLRPGDKIISVNNTNMCNMSHEEAIGFLRTCPDTVTLKLYRDAMQTPVSPASPTEPDVVSKPKALRKEARDMLTDLAMRKQSPSNSMNLTGATSSPGTPRRRRLQKTPSPDIKSVVIDRWDSLVRKTEEESLPDSPTVENKISLNSIRETDHEDSPFGDSQTDESTSTTIRSRNSSAASSCSYTPSNSESSRPKRPSFLDLSNGRSCPRKTQFTPPHEVDQSFPSPLGAQYPSADSLDSAPQLTSAHSDTPAFSYLHQGYHSVNLGALHQHEDLTLTNTTSDHNISGHDNEGPSNNGLLKWKGIVFTPDEEDSPSVEDSVKDDDSAGGSPKSQKPKMVTLELNRGWNSRLGFSLQPQGDDTIITAIYADSVAAKDGRLRIGDIIVKVNDVDVVGWDSESVIDLLRKTRGKISLTVLQQPC